MKERNGVLREVEMLNVEVNGVSKSQALAGLGRIVLQ